MDYDCKISDLTEEQLMDMMPDLESDRIERTTSFREEKLGPAVCAFSNDFANHQRSGFILLGVDDKIGKPAGIKIGDDDLQKIGNVKSNGNVLPQPSIKVSKVFNLPEGDVVVVEVQPSHFPPVRYDGRCWIRVGPRKSKATLEEEKMLIEKRVSFAKTFDLLPALESNLNDLSIDLFKINYLPSAIDNETLVENGRTIEEQLSSLRFYDPKVNCPTNAGLLLFGKSPEYYLPGAYIQYVKFEGVDMTTNAEFEKKFNGALISELPQLDGFIKVNIIKERPQKKDSFREDIIRNYPYWALRELIMNAIMHRNYDSNAPIYIYEFSNRIEVVNPGGLFGEATPQNFPNASDYRNVVIAESMKIMGYVNRFNYGVKRAIQELENNGNGQPDFNLDLQTKFKVTIPINNNW